MMTKILSLLFVLCVVLSEVHGQQRDMNEMWDGKAENESAFGNRGRVFREGRYAMFVHWGYYSLLGNQWNGKTYYGIGEWLMNSRMADLSVEDYKSKVGLFNPVSFNADSLVALAKNAGMKYIVITSKHHDGFAMFRSKYSAFNIYDATLFKRDPMKEMAAACKKAGLGLGFYYSQTQDWTTPGGFHGPVKDKNGKEVTFDMYFKTRCLPEVNQLTTAYGPIALVWFDTPANISKEYAAQLVDLVHKNQPDAFVSGRVGHGLGDYSTLGDMEVPKKNIPGLWETVEVTNDSWGYAWYDQNWKTPRQVLALLLSTIARGGNFMINVGPKGDGTLPTQPAHVLRAVGDWVKRHQKIVYQGKPSPWKHALPWGDAIVGENKISLLVYDWPLSGRLFVPGLKTSVLSARLLDAGAGQPLPFALENGWLILQIPFERPDPMMSVIELNTEGVIAADEGLAIDPQIRTTLEADFALSTNCDMKSKQWMEKFGEWKHIKEVTNWQPGGTATWTIDVQVPGDYQAFVNYTGNGRLVWRITSDEGHLVQNQQNSSSVYHDYPLGWLQFDKGGTHTITIELLEGDRNSASLASVGFEPVQY
ncbi:alpha-L-fucosidase [Chryseolinea lacunae]|uniref:alpha-L-fucosidase n=1 Tax=Chryseolinea lacunae TaxID=2801331 RepID=A0ABS1L248_9BACT|nr:alpha-L-fucosidase [Chryseolinea lacunae]MBL0745755.1 alpha-L-fucosidase [Chryseolinea lacunae]